MSKSTLLLEIGLEEMPARFVTSARQELQSKVEAWLKDKRLTYSAVTSFSTPRRLAVKVNDVPVQQPDMETEARGPSEKIALNDGEWTKAALGFAKGQGVSTEDLYLKEVKGERYVFALKKTTGKRTMELLPELRGVLLAITFPKNMKWGSYQLRYVRPVKWLTALFGSEVIPFEITGIPTGKITHGHRFLGDAADLTSADVYEEELLSQHVIVDPHKRKEAIRTQIQDIAAEEGWEIPIDEGLLEEVTNLVEYPTALSGSFDESFLNVPDEVLITSMREHQRYFPVKNKQGKLAPHFITVRNGDHLHLDNVRRGNEKVLRARLADAEFFYEEDLKGSLESRLPKLASIVYHEELGTMADKTARIEAGALQLASLLHGEGSLQQTVQRAARLSKVDLVTHMVDEFPELEGLMGEYYAIHDGEQPDTAKAIREHYLPKHAGDSLPETEAGRIVSTADKLDTILTSIGIGRIPTGSQDPYGLRRQAAAVLQIYLDGNWSFDLFAFIQKLLGMLDENKLLNRPHEEVFKDVKDFFELRFRQLLKDRGIRYDVTDAVIRSGWNVPAQAVAKSDFLMNQLDKESFKKDTEAFSRVTNISKKSSPGRPDPALFQEDQESSLAEACIQVEEPLQTSLNERNVEQAYRQLQSIVPVINDYFDHVMVMAEDEQLKQNRLFHMHQTASLIRQFADFQQIVFHSE
ncbi:glycine--tRNA ligase subunit beta [Bacillus daqingensis]|uniref:Glycine--tRNA ligase beta subunit n=1 Tax=Bacillus daqingensis TaxID=872396 RepID=A0ABV9P202_9BACI